MYREKARALVATWPPLTEQDNRELTNIAAKHAGRVRLEQREEQPLAA